MATVAIAPPAKSRSQSPFEILQPQTTFTGAPIEPLEKGLPKRTQSVCPECLRVIEARLFEEGGAVYMEKVCAEHGYVRDKIYSASEEEPLVIPEEAIVVPGSRAVTQVSAAKWGLSLQAAVIVKYRDAKTDARVQLEDLLR